MAKMTRKKRLARRAIRRKLKKQQNRVTSTLIPGYYFTNQTLRSLRKEMMKQIAIAAGIPARHLMGIK